MRNLKTLLTLFALTALLAGLIGCRNMWRFDEDENANYSVVTKTVKGKLLLSTSPSMRASKAGTPFAGARVWIEGIPELYDTTDDDGSFSIPGVPLTSTRIVAKGFHGGVEYKNRSSEILLDDQETEADLALFEAKCKVKGVITNADGSFPPLGTVATLWGEEF